MRNTITELRISIDGNPDIMSPGNVAKMVWNSKSVCVKAMQNASTSIGRKLRENGVIRMDIGVTGRQIVWGAATSEQLEAMPELVRVRRWHKTVGEALDALTCIAEFGKFLQNLQDVAVLEGYEMLREKQRLVNFYESRGGFPGANRHLKNDVLVVFRGDNCAKEAISAYNRWRKEVRELEAAEAAPPQPVSQVVEQLLDEVLKDGAPGIVDTSKTVTVEEGIQAS